MKARLLIVGLATGCGYVGVDLEQDESALDLDGVQGAPPGEEYNNGMGGAEGDGDIASGQTGGSRATGGADWTGGYSSTGGTSGAGGDTGGADGTGGFDGRGGVDASGGFDGSGGTMAGAGGTGGNDGTGGGSANCSGNASVNFELVGWATQNGGTTGGRGGATVFVNSGAQLNSALATKSAFSPLTIMVSGTINFQNTGSDKIEVQGVRNVSIIGTDSGAEFNGVGLRLIESGNIVLRNLRIHHVAIGERDAISIHGPVDHVWVDHCELYATFQGATDETYDGLLDAKNDVRYLTYSWNHFHDSWSPMLAGSVETDTTDRRLTMHHNWIENVNASAPTFRAGSAHVFNNVYEDVQTSAINSRLGACIRVENNVFSRVTNPWLSAYSTQLGGVDLVCNEIDDFSAFDYSNPEFHEAPACEATIPYLYESVLSAPDSVESVVKQNAGVGKLDEPASF